MQVDDVDDDQYVGREELVQPVHRLAVDSGMIIDHLVDSMNDRSMLMVESMLEVESVVFEVVYD